jgi:hypothetical protein
MAPMAQISHAPHGTGMDKRLRANAPCVIADSSALMVRHPYEDTHSSALRNIALQQKIISFSLSFGQEEIFGYF